MLRPFDDLAAKHRLGSPCRLGGQELLRRPTTSGTWRRIGNQTKEPKARHKGTGHQAPPFGMKNQIALDSQFCVFIQFVGTKFKLRDNSFPLSHNSFLRPA